MRSLSVGRGRLCAEIAAAKRAFCRVWSHTGWGLTTVLAPVLASAGQNCIWSNLHFRKPLLEHRGPKLLHLNPPICVILRNGGARQRHVGLGTCCRALNSTSDPSGRTTAQPDMSSSLNEAYAQANKPDRKRMWWAESVPTSPGMPDLRVSTPTASCSLPTRARTCVSTRH